MKKVLEQYKARLLSGVAALQMLPTVSQAGMPTQIIPNVNTGQNQQQNWLEILQTIFYHALVFGGLLVTTVAFFVVTRNVIASYAEIKTGKATWGDLGMHAVMGMALLAVTIFLLTQASSILAPASSSGSTIP